MLSILLWSFYSRSLFSSKALIDQLRISIDAKIGCRCGICRGRSGIAAPSRSLERSRGTASDCLHDCRQNESMKVEGVCVFFAGYYCQIDSVGRVRSFVAELQVIDRKQGPCQGSSMDPVDSGYFNSLIPPRISILMTSQCHSVNLHSSAR